MAPKPAGGRPPRRPKGLHPPPAGKVRQSQVLSVYGAGAMVDLLNDAVLVGGLDFWRGGEAHDEPRLRARLLRTFPHLRGQGAFRLAPECDDRDPTAARGIQVLEFPHWFVCQGCRLLVRLAPGAEHRAKRYAHACGPRGYFVPVRFVYACPHGHLSDFWWKGFITHKDDCPSKELMLTEGPTGDFGEVFVRCRTCKEGRALMSASIKDARPDCTGERPWLGDTDPEPCTEKMRLLQRTASNAYFTQVVSVVSIPAKRSAQDAVREIGLGILAPATSQNLDIFRGMPAVGPKLEGFPDSEILDALADEKAGKKPMTGEIRTAEFDRLTSSPAERLGELPDDDLFFARTAGTSEGLPKSIRRVVLVHRLCETRVQTSFTRCEDLAPNMQGEYPLDSVDLPVRPAPLARRVTWLPAVVARGEGVFVELDEAEVRKWEARPEVLARAKVLLAGHDEWRKGDDGEPREGLPEFFGARYYLLHSLAHLLIQAVSLSCGYSASSIRERIYCAPQNAEEPMAAVLLSTGTTGAEGTLGGLLDEGRRLESHLRRARDLALLCSNDPVCAHHDPSRDPTRRYLHGAACHGCLFIAEPSCEQFNRFLDRALVFPTLGLEELAFFKDFG
jgi:hypothetical protein